MLAPAAILVTTLLLVLLCLNDSKRRRAARLAGDGGSTTVRRMLAAVACVPGLVCLLLGDPAAFLVWIGGAGVAGWFVTLIVTEAVRRT